MKANRLNLCSVVRHSLIAAGYSTVKAVNAVNAELGKLASESVTSKTGEGKANTKKGEYKVSVSETHKLAGKLNAPLLFDAWHSQIAKAEKLARFDAVAIPGIFGEWLAKFAVGSKEELAKEQAEQVEVEA